MAERNSHMVTYTWGTEQQLLADIGVEPLHIHLLSRRTRRLIARTFYSLEQNTEEKFRETFRRGVGWMILNVIHGTFKTLPYTWMVNSYQLSIDFQKYAAEHYPEGQKLHDMRMRFAHVYRGLVLTQSNTSQRW